MLMPRVSVVIPTYNYARYVGKAIQSVLEQDYPNLEVIVVDDGSIDQTKEVVKPYLARIKYLYQQNGGTAAALNLGIGSSTGKYVCWLSSDDYFLPDKVAKQVNLMENDLTLGFSYTSFVVIDGLGNRQYEVHSPFYPEPRVMALKLLGGCFVNGSSVMLRKAALEQVGLFDPTVVTAHDYDLWFKLLRHYRCGFVDELLVAYRWHDSNGTRYVDPKYEHLVRERGRKLLTEWQH